MRYGLRRVVFCDDPYQHYMKEEEEEEEEEEEVEIKIDETKSW